MTTIEKLREQIRAANEAYWVKSQPIMSDPAYDKLVEALKKLSPEDPLIAEIGTEKLGDKKIRHAEHMYSIAKVYSYQDLLNWCSKVARSPDEKFLCSCKYDGLSVEYNDGKFITRGDGDVGNDITHLWQFIDIRRNFNDHRPAMSDDLVKTKGPRFVGELLVSQQRFDHLKNKFPGIFGTYKTPRNLASGFANLKTTEGLAPLVQKGEYLVATEPVCTIVDHRAHEIELSLTDLQRKKVDLEKELRDYQGMPCDGIVVRLKDEEYGKTLGVTQHHRNDYCALKFAEEEVDVTVREVVWQVGERHVTPVATFSPVELDGVQISNVTLHCPAFIEEKKVGPKSVLTIIRQGGVIPKVIRVDNGSEQNPQLWPFPEKCPCCESPLVREGAYLSCTNQGCTGKIAAKIVRGLGILGYKGIGMSLATKVVRDFMIPDLITWMNEMGDPKLLKAKGYTAHQIGLITRSVDNSIKTPVHPSTLLRAMCIEDVGEMFTKAVVNNYDGGIISLVNTVPADYAYDILRGIPGLRLDGITAFMVWFELNKERFLEFLNMFTLLTQDRTVVQQPSFKPDAQTYCFTGSGPKSRTELGADALKAGHRITDNANQCTTLVCADPNGNSSKLKKARAKGIRIIGYDEFLKELL